MNERGEGLIGQMGDDGYWLSMWSLVHGIGSLRLHNEALFAKWLWRFLMEPHGLWHKVIVNRYDRYCF